jgi:hypothetical protein
MHTARNFGFAQYFGGVNMTRKRFIKLAMSERMTRDEAIFAAKCALKNKGNY